MKFYSSFLVIFLTFIIQNKPCEAGFFPFYFDDAFDAAYDAAMATYAEATKGSEKRNFGRVDFINFLENTFNIKCVISFLLI